MKKHSTIVRILTMFLFISFCFHGVSQEDAKKEKKEESKIPRYREVGNPFSLSRKKVALIKNARIIPALMGNAYEDSILIQAIAAHWKFNKIAEPMPYEKAIELAKGDKNTLLMFNVKIITKTVKHSSGYSGVAGSKALVLQQGKYKVVLSNFFPTGKGYRSTQPMVNFAMSAMNSLLTNMDEQKLRSVKRLNLPYETYSKKLKTRRLLIPREWLSNSITSTDVNGLYHADFMLTSVDTICQAIMEKKPYAYVVPVPVSMGGSRRYYDYLMDAETGAVYYILRPGFFSEMAKISAPISLVSRTQIYDFAHNELISRKNLKKYNHAFEKNGDKEKEENVSGEGTQKKD